MGSLPPRRDADPRVRDPGGVTPGERAAAGSWKGRLEDDRLLRGAGRYTADDQSPSLMAHFVRSPFGHARIERIDLEQARQVPRVVAAYSASDLSALLPGDAPVLDVVAELGGSQRHVPRRPAMARGRVLFAGEPVAIVIASTAHAAADGAEAAIVSYADLPAVTGFGAGETSLPIHPALPDNLGFDWQGGDPALADRAFESAAIHFCAEIAVPRMHGLPLEPANARASYEPETGRWTLVVPSQGAHALRRELAEAYLQVSPDRLRVVTPDVGGAFGLRIHALPEHAVLLAAAAMLGTAVSWSASRAESMLAEPHSRGLQVAAELALDPDGTFLAIRAVSRCDLGAYTHPGSRSTPTGGMMFGLHGPYRMGAASLRVLGHYTNTTPTGPFRGAGQPEGTYVLERMIDLVAARHGFDPVALRRRNLLRPSDFPYRTCSGQMVDSGDPASLLDRTLAELGPVPVGAGAAVAMYMKMNGMGRSEQAEVEVRGDDGTIVVRIGSQSNGQGHETTFAHLAAEALEIPLDRIAIVQGDTDLVAHGTGTGASSALGTTGPGVAASSANLLEQARVRASELLGVAAHELSYSGGLFAAPGANQHASLHELARDGGPLVGRSQVGVTLSFTFGCHGCVVAVDPETGQPSVLHYAACDDVGRLLQPVIATGQVQGGVAQGLGQALLEIFRHDAETGQPVTATLMDYAVPRASDLPSLCTSFGGAPSNANRLGVRGAGEAGALCSMAAAVNAAASALGLSGEPLLAAPLTADRVWRVMQTVKQRRDSG